jgi:hypothetical protein
MAAGQQLRRKINAALRQASADTGTDLVFTEPEAWLIDRAVELEDWREQLQARRDAEQAREAGAATVVSLSGEVRRTINAIADLMGRVDFRADAAQPIRRPGRPGGQRPVA